MTLLPVDCQYEIISRITSPTCVARLSAVSRHFKILAASDDIWKKFLPSDLDEIFSGTQPIYRLFSKKFQFVYLVHRPLVLHGSHLSFALDKNSGKKIYMLGVRNITFTWEGYRKYWARTAHGYSRFGEVIISQLLWWFEIQCKIETNILSPNTVYVAFFVYSFIPDKCYGFMSLPINVTLGIIDERRPVDVMESSVYFAFHPRKPIPQDCKIPQWSYNGWLEVELGEFSVDSDNNNSVLCIRMFEMQQKVLKSGIIIEGIEFRPKV